MAGNHFEVSPFDTNGGLAEDALSSDRENAAASALANGGTGLLEVFGARRDLSRGGAVQVGHTQDIGGTALGRVVEAAARVIAADLDGSGDGHGGASQEGGDEGGEVHFEASLGLLWEVLWLRWRF